MVFVGKTTTQFENKIFYYIQVASMGVIFNVPVTKDVYDNINYQLGALLNEDLFIYKCTQKGKDIIIKLFLK